MPNNTSQHILNTSANLLGFCLVVITAIHINDQTETTIIDMLTALVTLLLAFSCLFSFISIRSENAKTEMRFETIADYLFFISLTGIISIITLILHNYLNK
jgi:uncharacterized membrane protein